MMFRILLLALLFMPLVPAEAGPSLLPLTGVGASGSGGGGGQTPTFVADGGEAHGTSSATPTAPAGVSLNDTLIICASVRTTGSGGTITTPSGFSLGATTGTAVDTGNTYQNLYLFYKTAASGDVTLSGSSGTYTISYNTGGTIAATSAEVRDYSGVKTSGPINSSATVLGTNSTVTTIPAFSETFISGELYVACEADENTPGSGPSSSPTLGHVYFNSGFLMSSFVGDYSPNGVPGTETLTNSNPGQGRPALAVTLKPGP